MGEPFIPLYPGQKHRDGLCRCGNEKAAGRRRCRACDAAAQRRSRANKKGKA